MTFGLNFDTCNDKQLLKSIIRRPKGESQKCRFLGNCKKLILGKDFMLHLFNALKHFRWPSGWLKLYIVFWGHLYYLSTMSIHGEKWHWRGFTFLPKYETACQRVNLKLCPFAKLFFDQKWRLVLCPYLFLPLIKSHLRVFFLKLISLKSK